MERALSRYEDRFETRVFTLAERTDCRARGQPAKHFAVRFAAKEALLKVLGVPPGLNWHEIEVLPTESGAPQLILSGAAAEVAQQLGITRLHVSLTHSADMAAAVVIGESI